MDENSRNNHGLSDAELDAQLTALNMEDALTSRQTGRTPEGGFKANVNDVIANAFLQIEQRSERDETVDAAVKAAAHGVKVLAPILQAVSKHGASPEQANTLMGKVLMRTNVGTNKVLEAYGLREGEAPAWLSATVSGQVIKLITNSLVEGNTSVLDKPDDSFIQPLIDYAQAATKLGAVAYPSASPDLEIANALMMATCNVMAEYQCFNYFHADSKKIAQEISTYFNERVVQGTLDDLTDRFTLKPTERSYMANSLLSSAGEMMAQSWKAGITDTIANLREMPKEARQEATVNGYPLSAVIERFESVYQGIELSCESAIRTLNPGRELSKAAMDQNKEQRLG